MENLLVFSDKELDRCNALIIEIQETGSTGPFYYIEDRHGKKRWISKEEARHIKGSAYC